MTPNRNLCRLCEAHAAVMGSSVARDLETGYRRTMKYVSGIFLAVTLFSAPAFAGSAQPDRVVELFTSQGCSSCPPANAMVSKLSDDETTLALSYGVTYWDYLGWKDTFADPKFTKRQKSYGKQFEMSHLYTPQIVLNGASHGSRYSASDIRTMDLPAPGVKVELTPVGSGLKAKVSCQDKMFEAVLVEYVKGPQSVPVKAGENHGRTLTISNVVTDVTRLGLWSIDDQAELPVADELSDGKAYALILHDPENGQIVSAATYR